MNRKKAKFILWLHRTFGCHLFWKYRNPSCRTCSVCKQEQNEFAWSISERGWWETVVYGKHGEEN